MYQMRQKRGVYVTSKVFDTISKTKIFCDADKEKLKEILFHSEIEVREYKKGETIYSLSEFSLAVGIFLKGSARVIKDNGVVISTLNENDIFGCASLFASKDYYVNNIVAIKDCKVIFIDRETVERLMKEDVSFSLSFIKYLSDRLYYLNTRIVSFTAGSAESRLAYYLYNYFSKNECTQFSVCTSQLASTLDVGRASLYRAFDSLCEKGAIIKEGKIVRLISESELKSFITQ